jgi:hypothetical protein
MNGAITHFNSNGAVMHQNNVWWFKFFIQEPLESEVARIISMSEIVDGCRYMCFKYDGHFLIIHYNEHGVASIAAVV